MVLQFSYFPQISPSYHFHSHPPFLAVKIRKVKKSKKQLIHGNEESGLNLEFGIAAGKLTKVAG